MTGLKVLICGGGIAGNGLAFWLSRQGHDITVIERYPAVRLTGLQLDLRGYGVEVMRRMGLEQAFRAKSIDEQGLGIVDSSGRVRAFFPANKTGKGLQSFTSDFEIMRGEFVQILYDATRERAKYLFGIWVVELEQHQGSVDVVFSDGKKGQYDLVVGADGQNSRTRRMMLGPGSTDPIHHLDQYMGYFTTPEPIQEGEGYNCMAYLGTDKRLLMTRRHIPEGIQVYMSARLDDVRKGDVEGEKAAFAKAFRGAGWKSDEFIKAMYHAKDFYCERPGVVKLDSWSIGRVVVVGDAAYCPTANTGMGTTSGLVGAYILAGEIQERYGRDGTSEDLLAALKGYNTVFRPFMAEVQKGVVDDDVLDKLPTTAWGIAILHIIVAFAAFFRLNVLAKMVLRENAVKDWSLPDYDGMVGNNGEVKEE